MSQNIYYSEQPALVKTVAILTLINGIVNIFWGLFATAAVVPTIILACLSVFTILPTILGVFEIIYALKLLSNPPQPVGPSNAIAILEILCVLTGNVFSMIVGILSLVFYNDEQVKAYFASLSRIPYPVDTAPSAPPERPTEPKPAPLMEKTLAEPESPVESKQPEEPEKPRKRKVAQSTKTSPKKETGRSSAGQ
jgi:hypothetical protein